jgi:ligand-binding sensor domain-containing protein/signal transduction histidine kinase
MSVRAILIAFVGCSLCLWAELLPIRSYTIADGLPADHIDGIVVDSRGFVWFCTPEGLSRFDGYRFTNFGTEEGLPHRAAQAFLETRSGEYLVGTPRGLCLFRASRGKNQFVTYRPGNTPAQNDVNALLESSSGRIWAGTSDGLFEVLKGFKFRRQALPDPPPGWKGIQIGDIAEDACGKLWLATISGIYVIGKEGTVQRISKPDGLPSDYVNTLLAAKDGRLWTGTRGGLAMLRDGCTAGAPGLQRVYSADLGQNVVSLAEGSDGALWLGTAASGITRLLPGDVNASFQNPTRGQNPTRAQDPIPAQHLTRANGLTDRAIFSLASDKAGNIWAGTEGAGVMNIRPAGFTTFREQDGLPSDRVWSVLGDRAGSVLAITASESQRTWSLSIFDGAKFHSMLAPKVFAEHRTWGNHRILLQSQAGEWWAATAKGLCRYTAVMAEGLANRSPEACYFQQDDVFQIFEDSKGGVWASAQSPPQGNTLMRWDPGKKAIVTFEEFPGRDTLVKSFAEDPQGNIWMGMWGNRGLYRYNGRQFTGFSSRDGVPPGTIFALLTDSMGRLWIGAASGLALVENPGVGPFRLRTYHQSDGLSSNTVRAIVEDKEGYIYAATAAGVDRLNPKTGRIKHFSTADGLARGEAQSAFRDPSGNLWFATAQGLSRLAPATARPLRNPAVLITGLQTGGVPFPVSPWGETSISRIELEPSRNQLQVEFVAFSGEPEANLRYAYKLESADSDWSPPRSQHLVNYAALATGKYRFLVKALNSDGLESATPAEVDFTVLPPFWRRWWFEGLALAALASIVYLLHSYRVAQMVSLERMRTMIATDLHDDIGASLSQIAILSEVARAGVGSENRLPQESLQRVATLARELVDSMSDIVWSIRAEPDDLDSLVRRMREFALDLLTSQGIGFELRAPQPGENAHLSLQARRHLFLMFKECIHNVSRHSGCTAVEAELKLVDREIVLTVEDNGRGLNGVENPPGWMGGTGIPGMRRRAETLGGSIQFISKPGEGCTVSIRLPVRRGAFAKELV